MRKLLLIVLLVLGFYYVRQYISERDLQKSTSGKVLPETIAVQPDPRVQKVQSFLESYDSPMAESSQTFIEVADEYKLDWRLLPAIAGTESTFGKYTPSCASFNAFGWTSLSSPCGYWRFNSFDESIRHVAEQLTQKACYRKFIYTGKVEDLAIPYNQGNQTWIASVNYFIDELE